MIAWWKAYASKSQSADLKSCMWQFCSFYARFHFESHSINPYHGDPFMKRKKSAHVVWMTGSERGRNMLERVNVFELNRIRRVLDECCSNLHTMRSDFLRPLRKRWAWDAANNVNRDSLQSSAPTCGFCQLQST